jgi:Flp pilus assembly protein TadG
MTKQPEIGRNESGASAVEFALVLPMLLLILFAIVEYGWFFTNRIVLTNAVSNAARAAVKAREWEGEDPTQFAGQAFKSACWIADGEDVSIVGSAASIGSMPKGEVAMAVDVDGETVPRTVSVIAVMGYRPLTGFLPQRGNDSGGGLALLPSEIAAKSVMVFP